MGIFDDALNDEALRGHIRKLLYDYALEHLTTNHVEFTEQAVAELLSQCLHEVPLIDNFSIRPPVEPFDTLTRIYGLGEIQPYEEKASNSPEAMQYLRSFLASLKPAKGFKSRSERAVENNDYEIYTPEERFEPILSRRARQSTPHAGSNSFRKSLNTPYATFLQSSAVDIKPVKVERIQEPVVKLETALNVTWSLTPELSVAVKELLKSTAALSRPGPAYKNRFLDPTARPDSPPLRIGLGSSLTEPGPEFTPIFPRSKMFGSGRSSMLVNDEEKDKAKKEKNKTPKFRLDREKEKDKDDVNFSTKFAPPRSMAELARKLSPVKMDQEDDEPDLLKENMAIVSGWQTYCSSSPAKPSQSPSSSPTSAHTQSQSSQEIDQLGPSFLSSPDTELTPIKLLKTSRMDLPAIPRSKRIGGTTTKPKKIGAKQSYAGFLLDALPNARALAEPKTPERGRRDAIGGPSDDAGVGVGAGTGNDAPEPAATASLVPFDAALEAQTTESMVGQPPTALGTGFAGTEVEAGARIEKRGKDDLDEIDFDDEIKALYRDVKDVDPKGFILDERLDVKNDMLMDVPHLLPPNEHPPNDALYLPTRMSQFVAEKNGNGNSKKDVHRFLKKPKGFQSATTNLRWEPFRLQEPLPTHAEIVAVHELVGENAFDRLGMSRQQGLAKVAELIESVRRDIEPPIRGEAAAKSDPETTKSSTELLSRREQHIWAKWLESSPPVIEGVLLESVDRCEIVLSREERRRLAGLGEEKADFDDKNVGNVGEEQQAVGEEGVDRVGDSGGAASATARESTRGDSEHRDEQRRAETTLHHEPEPSALHSHPYDSAPPEQEELPYSHSEMNPHFRTYSYDQEIYNPKHSVFLSDSMAPEYDEQQFEAVDPYEEGEDDIDSDKENQAPLRSYSYGMMPLEQQDWDVPSIREDDAENEEYRPYKRPRLDGEEYRGEEGDREAFIDDSGIGLLPGFVSAAQLPRTDDQYQESGAEYGLEFDHHGNDRPSRSENFQNSAGRVDRSYHDEPGNLDDSQLLVDSNYHLVDHGSGLSHRQDSAFVPLSFDSQPMSQIPDPRSSQHPPQLERGLAPLPTLHENPSPPPRSQASPLRVPPQVIGILDHSAGVAEFAKLRAKQLCIPDPTPAPAHKSPTATEAIPLASRTAPETIFDKNTLRIPTSPASASPTSVYWYMASIDLLQKQALIRALRSPVCSIGLVERDTLGDVDLIVAPHTAIVITNLLALPSECESLCKNLCAQSYRYTHLLVIFEAYTPSMSFKGESASSAKESLSVYSPPVVKAVKKLRRDLSVAGACGSKKEGCRVMTAFADSVEEAAMLARIFGSEAETRDTSGGTIWGERAWLENEIDEDERRLAEAEGMNRFAACMILCQISVEEFLDIGPEERITRFAPQIGEDRMLKLNEVIAKRLEEMQEDGESCVMPE